MTNAKSDPVQRLQRILCHWDSIVRDARWYATVVPELNVFRASIMRESSSIQQACKELLYDFFEIRLTTGDIALASNDTDTDADRKPIDTVVIHHTSNASGLRPERLSAIELIRLYAPYYAHSTQEAEQRLLGDAISSGHVRDGKQVFWPYHWIVRNDGTTERLLYDPEIGWHAGNWDINCRSVAIVLDNDYENSSPSITELAAVAGIITQQYPRVPLGRIFGHLEVNSRTICPSKLFLDAPDRKGWKSRLLDLLSHELQQAA